MAAQPLQKGFWIVFAQMTLGKGQQDKGSGHENRTPLQKGFLPLRKGHLCKRVAPFSRALEKGTPLQKGRLF